MARSVMDRRSRGTRWSSSCFQICAALGFLVFMVRSREEVDSPQLTVHSQKKGQRLNTESTEAAARRSQRKKKANPCATSDSNFALSAGTGRSDAGPRRGSDVTSEFSAG